MALGLFARQAPIGLEVPEWLNVYFPRGGRVDWPWVREIMEGAATMGVRGVTLVAADKQTAAGHFTMEKIGSIVNETVPWRPWFRALALDEGTFLEQEGALGLAAGRTLVLQDHASPPAACPPEPPASLVGDWAVIIDRRLGLVGKGSSPIRMVHEVAWLPQATEPWGLPHWRDEFDSGILRTLTILLALNLISKPGRFRNNAFLMADEYADETVVRAFNERNLKPRWIKEKKTAQPEPQTPTEEPPELQRAA